MDAYCERVGMGLFAEPLNAVSSISFLLAAWAAWVLARRAGALSAGVRALIALAASVGIGSILWHTYPTMLTLVLDSEPNYPVPCGFTISGTRAPPCYSAKACTPRSCKSCSGTRRSP